MERLSFQFTKKAPTVTRSDVKAEVISSIGSMLSKCVTKAIATSNDFGSFRCSIERFNDFAIIRRNFTTADDTLSIPFSCSEPSIQMIFSFDGLSAFNDRFNPFLLSLMSHSLNYFKQYECSNLLEENGRQHDISFRLNKSFYTDLIASHLSFAEDRLPSMIFHEQSFNTINQHLPTDAGILGILKNIVDCPYQGEMKQAFIREHIRALLMLQLFHFSPIVSGKKLSHDGKITKRDEDILHDIKNYLDQCFLDASSLESLSKQFGINEFKLKHGFKVIFNTSPMRYLQYKRLEYSRMLLRNTGKSIKEIADEIGYAHAANFTTAFVKTFGNSPIYYRAGN
jgi:AraC-like DNA-binding protein